MLPFQHMFTTYSLYVTQSSMNMRWHFVIFGTYPWKVFCSLSTWSPHIHSLGRSGQIYGNHLSFTRLVHVHQICPYEPSTIKLEMSWIWFMKLVLEPDSLSSNHELFLFWGKVGWGVGEVCLLARVSAHTEMTCMHKLKCVGHCVLAFKLVAWNLCGVRVNQC